MIDFLTNWKPPQELSNPNFIWEWLEFEVKNFVSTYTCRSHSLEKEHTEDLYKELTELYRSTEETGLDVSTEIESIRRELKEIEESRAQKFIFRAGSNWILYGERPSKYFLFLEKRKNKERTLGTVISEEGQTLTKPDDILHEGRRFYAKLYKDREDVLTPIDVVEEGLNGLDVPQLAETEFFFFNKIFILGSPVFGKRTSKSAWSAELQQNARIGWATPRILCEILVSPGPILYGQSTILPRDRMSIRQSETWYYYAGAQKGGGSMLHSK